MRAILAAALLALSVAQSSAQEQICAPYDKLKAQIQEQYGEKYAAVGRVDESAILVVFAAPSGGSWTALAVYSDGEACTVASGDEWSAIPTGEGV